MSHRQASGKGLPLFRAVVNACGRGRHPRHHPRRRRRRLLHAFADATVADAVPAVEGAAAAAPAVAAAHSLAPPPTASHRTV